MATEPVDAAEVEEEVESGEPTSASKLKDWLIAETGPYMVSMLVHMVLILGMAVFMGTREVVKVINEAPNLEAAEDVSEEIADSEIEHFEIGDTSLDPSTLDTESLTLTSAPTVEMDSAVTGTAGFADGDTTDAIGGGTPGNFGGVVGTGTGFNIRGVGMGPVGKGVGGGGAGTGTNFGKGGEGYGFGVRDGKSRGKMLGSGGGTKQSERAVAGALNWLARHQRPDGSWALDHTSMCKDGTCTEPGSHKSDTAATAFGLLPFLAAGQTHMTKGPYQQKIALGLRHLCYNQKQNGALGGGMYEHGLATIALCEAYGMSQDKDVGRCAQAAINYIATGQDPQTGGWWYAHGQKGGDTSVFGWQLMALKSGQMAYLNVSSQTMTLASRWLDSVAKGQYKGQFAYRPESGAGDTMTAVGLLTRQYLGMQKDDPAMQEGVKFLMTHSPDKTNNFYYWYYATQVMHNIPGPDWDAWNRQMRKKLIETQCKNGCCEGSWTPTGAGHVTAGGRVMSTSIGALTLEVYYRYLPLYRIEGQEAMDKAN